MQGVLFHRRDAERACPAVSGIAEKRAQKSQKNLCVLCVSAVKQHSPTGR